MDDLIAFLRARWDEAEARAKRIAAYGGCCSGCHCGCNDPAYVLADIASKRKILDVLAPDLTAPVITINGPGVFVSSASRRGRARIMARLFAEPYVDHDDYQTGWRP